VPARGWAWLRLPQISLSVLVISIMHNLLRFQYMAPSHPPLYLTRSTQLFATRTDGAAAASRDAFKRRQYHAGGIPAALSIFPLSVESYGRLGKSAMQYLNTLAEAALASCAAGTDVVRRLSSLEHSESLE
jgi:hypothetical protein